jgi:hypothetical protein
MTGTPTRYRVEFWAPSNLGAALVNERVTTDRGPEFALEVAVARHIDRNRYMARRLDMLDIDRAAVRPQTTEATA